MVVGAIASVLAAVSALHGHAGPLRTPLSIRRASPVVACAAKEAQAADLKAQVAALKESVAAREKDKLSTPEGPGRADAVAAMAAEIRELEDDIAAKEQAIVELIGVQVRYSAVGRMRERQAKERAERSQPTAPEAADGMPTTELLARAAAGAVLLGSGLVWVLLGSGGSGPSS